MKTIYALIFLLCMVSASIAGTWNTQQVYASSGTQDTPVVGWSETGASAGYFGQAINFDSAALTVERTGTTGCAPATSAALVVHTGPETTGTSLVFQFGGCFLLSGDNYFVGFGDCSISPRGGIRRFLNRETPGAMSIDIVDSQLMAEDGITPVLSWSGSSVGIFHGSFRSRVSTLATADRLVILPDKSGTIAMIGDALAPNGNGSALVNTVTVLSGTLVSGTSAISNTGLAGKHPWLQSTGTNALGLTLTGTTATIRSASPSDASIFNLFFGNF